MDLRDFIVRFTGGCVGKKKSEVHESIHRIFGKEMILKENDEDAVLRRKYIAHVSANLNRILDLKCIRYFKKTSGKAKPPFPSSLDERPGRIGPKVVVLDTVNAVGRLLLFGDDRTSVQGLSTFSTIRGTACVYTGKWMYEVQIGSNKIMQIGWCSPHCRFTSDAGVGDTRHSYCYDGARVRSWNLSTTRYGDPWLVGDVIGSCIDLDKGAVEFYRNGQSMGVAFREVYRAMGYAYFPAVSVALQENLCANFGHAPFLFPVEGYQPIQMVPEWEVVRTEILLIFLENLLDESIVESRDSSTTKLPPASADSSLSMSKKAFFLSLALSIFKTLTPLLQNSYAVISKFLPLLRSLLGLPTSWRNISTVVQHLVYEDCARNMFLGVKEKIVTKPHPRLCLFLDWFWAFLEESTAISVLQRCVVRECQVYEVVSQDFFFRRQLHGVFFMCGLMQHPHTRLQLIKHVLFGKISFDTFLHIACPEEKALKVALQAVWWKKATPVTGEQEAVLSEEADEDNKNRKMYLKDCENISESTKPLENLQVEYILLMLVDNDCNVYSPSTRKLFLDKFRRFIMDNCIWDMSIFRVSRATAASWWDCHARILSAIIRLCSDSRDVAGCELFGVPAPSAKIFIDGELDFFNVDRLGGVLPYLVKTYKTELISMLGEDNLYLQSFEPNYNRAGGIDASTHTGPGVASAHDVLDGPPPGVPTLPQVMSSLARFLRGASTPHMPASNDYSMMIGAGGVPLKNALTVLLDGLLAMFHGSAKKFAEKVCEKRDSHLDIADCLFDVETRIDTINKELDEISKLNADGKVKAEKETLEDILQELIRSKDVYEEAVQSGAVKCAWTRASVWSRRSAIELSQLAAASLYLVSSAADPAFPSVQSNEIPLQESEYLRGINAASSSNTVEGLASHHSEKKNEEHKPKDDPTSDVSDSINGAGVKNDAISPIVFAFVPVYFVEGALDLCNTIRLYMPPTLPTSQIPGWEELLTSLASLVCATFADSRVALASVRESLVQTLASLATQAHTMRAIERAPEKQQMLMIEELLKPYNNRSWAQSNWVLVRFWHGSGFGYRHRQWPHLIAMYGDREPTVMNYGAQVDAGLMSQCFGPCPSPIIQERIKAYMIREPKCTATFLNSLLTQINWAFSEFYNMLQELQASRSSIDNRTQPRHIKMCGTFFDLYHGLARALEMILHLVPTVLTNKELSDGQNDLLLSRTCQTIITLASRLCSSGAATFTRVIDRYLPGLERLHYYTALAPLAGCLIQLLDSKNPPEHLCKVEAALSSEPLFKAEDWLFMLGQGGPGRGKVFSFRDYGDAVSQEELQALEACVRRLASLQVSSSSSSSSRTSTCAICYSRKPDTRMLPCGHCACRSCIEQHRLNNNFCFFCKSEIEAIESVESLSHKGSKKGSKEKTNEAEVVTTTNINETPTS